MAKPDNPETFPAVIYRNEFILVGPTAEHFCIVTEPLSLSLQAFTTACFGQCGRIPIWMIKRLVRSILRALDHLQKPARSCMLVCLRSPLMTPRIIDTDVYAAPFHLAAT